MLTLYNFVAIIVFYVGLAVWMHCENSYVRLPAIICSTFAFEYLLGWFP